MGWSVHDATLGNGLRLEFAIQGDGFPVLLLHGYVGSWRSFEPILPWLPGWLWVAAPSLRGHGQSDCPVTGYTIPDFGTDVMAFMDAVGMDSAVLVGESSGGYVAQWVAGRFPDRVRGLVTAGTPRTFDDKPAFHALHDEIMALSDPIDPGFARRFGGDSTFPHLTTAFIEARLAESGATPARVWRETYLGFEREPTPSEAASITTPTLILRGERDHFVTHEEMVTLRDAIPGANLVTYPGAGHILVWDEPERMARDVVAFVARLAGQARGANAG